MSEEGQEPKEGFNTEKAVLENMMGGLGEKDEKVPEWKREVGII